MSKEEQIALELTKITGATTSGSQCTIDNYKKYLKELQQIKNENDDIDLLNDELGTYKYILGYIKKMLKQDSNNFILKENLEEVLRGIE